MNRNELYLFLALHAAIQPKMFEGGMFEYLSCTESNKVQKVLDKYFYKKIFL